MGRIDEAKRAIMEAEVLDETNPNVWVQVGVIYFAVLSDDRDRTLSLTRCFYSLGYTMPR